MRERENSPPTVNRGTVDPSQNRRVAIFGQFLPRYLLNSRQSFQVRFMIGANLLGILVAIPALVISIYARQFESEVLISAFILALMGQLAAIRFGVIRLPWMIWFEMGILASFLTLQSLVTVEFEPIQLQWFLLIPLAALVLMDPQHRSSGATLPLRPVLLASIIAVTLGIGVILAKNTGLTFGGESGPETMLNTLVNFLLFMFAMCGLIYLYDKSLRETFAELEALRKLLPLCAWCKDILDHDGEWIPIDIYVAKHYCEITHSICPGCSRKHFDNYQA